MKKYDAQEIRNIGLIGHGSVGKTSLTEAILFDAKAIERLGKVDDGSTTTDYDDDEKKRKITINTAIAHCEWKKHKINVIDMPGFGDFIVDTKVSLSVADTAVVLVCGVSGVEVMTDKTWGFAADYNLPRMIVINKLDRERASFERALGSIQKAFGDTAVPVQIPIGEEANFKGVVDLIARKAYVYSDASGKFTESAVPDDLSDAVETYREGLVEKAAEGKDELIEKYLETGELTDEEIIQGLQAGLLAGKIYPVLCASTLKNIGIAQLLDAVVNFAPSPLKRPAPKGKVDGQEELVECAPNPSGPVYAQVFKTVVDPFAGRINMIRVYSGTLTPDAVLHNLNKDKKERIGQLAFLNGKKQTATDEVGIGDLAAVIKLSDTGTGDTLSTAANGIILSKVEVPKPIISFAVKTKSRGDEDKIGTAFSRLMLEDLTLKYHRHEQTKEFLVSGMGQLHVEIMVDKLRSQFGVDVVLAPPKVPYLETIKGKIELQGRHKKQTGGHGQFGDCWLRIEPLPRGAGFEFVDEIVGGAIPRQFIPAVEKGVVEAMQGGFLAGYPAVDIRVTVYDGSYHPVDSSEMAFKIAGSLAFKNGAKQAKPTLLEPIMKLDVFVPEECMGDIMGDINSRRGRVLGMDSQRGIQKISALVPMAEILKYAPALTSMTGGRGTYTMDFDHYEEVPAQLQEKIIEESKKAHEEAE